MCRGLLKTRPGILSRDVGRHVYVLENAQKGLVHREQRRAREVRTGVKHMINFFFCCTKITTIAEGEQQCHYYHKIVELNGVERLQ